MSNLWILVSRSFGTLGLWKTSDLYTLKLSITELPNSWLGPHLSRWHHHVASLQHSGTLGLQRFPQHNLTFLLNVKLDNSLNCASPKFLDYNASRLWDSKVLVLITIQPPNYWTLKFWTLSNLRTHVYDNVRSRLVLYLNPLGKTPLCATTTRFPWTLKCQTTWRIQ